MIRQFVNKLALRLISISRRLDPYYRDSFDKYLQKYLVNVVQFFIRLFYRSQNLTIAEEKQLPNEKALTDEIAATMNRFLKTHYKDKNKIAERAGNTKTYGILKAEISILPELPENLKVGIFAKENTFPAYIRCAGPGPEITPDIDNNGILSIGLKVMNVPGEKLLKDEKYTQDFLGLTCPTFTTPDLNENIVLQREVARNTPAWYFLNPLNSHYLDAIMQGLFSRTYANPLELQYHSCVPFLLGDAQAIKFLIRPSEGLVSKVGSLTDNYLREAMVDTLGKKEVTFDFLVQLQTDANKMPIENASISWSETLSPFIPVAKIVIPKQDFTSDAQLDFSRNLSFNPWHSLAVHRPLGNLNRGRKTIYQLASAYRQSINNEEHIEPDGSEKFETHDARQSIAV